MSSTVVEQLAHDAPGLTDDLLRFARTLTSDAALAEDLVQETFVRALASADRFRAEAGLRTWLHRILHHLDRPGSPVLARTGGGRGRAAVA